MVLSPVKFLRCALGLSLALRAILGLRRQRLQQLCLNSNLGFIVLQRRAVN